MNERIGKSNGSGADEGPHAEGGTAGPFPNPDLPGTGAEIIREVERLKNAPVQFHCLGMSLGGLFLIIGVVVLIWLLVR